MEHITSRSNALITRIRKLVAERKHRRREGVMVCEGPKMLGEALRWGAALDTVVWEAGKARAQDIPDGVRQVEVPGDLLAALAPTQTPQGVLFLCQLPERALPEKLEGQRYLVLDGVQDPGNVGTIWRTCDAAAFDALLISESCPDPFSPKVLRASMGAAFRVPVLRVNMPKALDELRQCGCAIVSSQLDGAPFFENLPGGDAAIVIGNEARGVSEDVRALATHRLKLPMPGGAESLNAAVAAGIMIYACIAGRR